MITRKTSESWLVLALILTFGPAVAMASGVDDVLPKKGPRNLAVEAKNKTIVKSVYDKVFNAGDVTLIDQLFAADLIQHDPELPNGRRGVVAFVEELRARKPQPTYVIKNTLAYQDMVGIYTNVTATPNDETTGHAVLDLYRLDEGVIVEHWTTVQAVPSKTINGNTMFSIIKPTPFIPGSLRDKVEELNREQVLEWHEKLFNHDDVSMVDKYFDPRLSQHNPLATNGTNALKELISSGKFGIRWKTHFALAEEGFVLLYQHAVPPGRGDLNNPYSGLAIADIFLIQDGKVVEHWDIIQNVPAKSVNGNTMFSSLYTAKSDVKK